MNHYLISFIVSAIAGIIFFLLGWVPLITAKILLRNNPNQSIVQNNVLFRRLPIYLGVGAFLLILILSLIFSFFIFST